MRPSSDDLSKQENSEEKEATVNSRNDTPDKIISIYAPNTMLEKAEKDAAEGKNINIDSGKEEDEEEKIQPMTS